MFGFQMVRVSGAPDVRGQQYGVAAEAQIRKSASLYRERIALAGLSELDFSDLVAGLVPQIEAFDPRYIMEMRGIARGASMSFEDIVLINARTELLAMVNRPGIAGGLEV